MKNRRPALVSPVAFPLLCLPFRITAILNNSVPPAKMADIPEAYPPSKIGEYTVVAEIAEGTFGKVKSLLTFLLGTTSATSDISEQWQSIPLQVIK